MDLIRKNQSLITCVYPSCVGEVKNHILVDVLPALAIEIFSGFEQFFVLVYAFRYVVPTYPICSMGFKSGLRANQSNRSISTLFRKSLATLAT